MRGSHRERTAESHDTEATYPAEHGMKRTLGTTKLLGSAQRLSITASETLRPVEGPWANHAPTLNKDGPSVPVSHKHASGRASPHHGHVRSRVASTTQHTMSKAEFENDFVEKVRVQSALRNRYERAQTRARDWTFMASIMEELAETTADVDEELFVSAEMFSQQSEFPETGTVINPMGSARMAWDAVSLFLIFYVATVTPFENMVLGVESRVIVLYSINVFMDAYFLL